MKRQWWAVAALAWAGVVAVVALVAWWVIDGAGEDVLADSAADVVTATPTEPDPSASESDRPEPTESPTTSASSDSPPPPSPSTDEPAPVRRTSSWQGEAGLLRVSCTGASLRLEGASPNDGWVVDQNQKKSDSELEVRFESADGDRRAEIEARCVGGVPDFNVELDD